MRKKSYIWSRRAKQNAHHQNSNNKSRNWPKKNDINVVVRFVFTIQFDGQHQFGLYFQELCWFCLTMLFVSLLASASILRIRSNSITIHTIHFSMTCWILSMRFLCSSPDRKSKHINNERPGDSANALTWHDELWAYRWLFVLLRLSSHTSQNPIIFMYFCVDFNETDWLAELVPYSSSLCWTTLTVVIFVVLLLLFIVLRIQKTHKNKITLQLRIKNASTNWQISAKLFCI